MKCRRAGWTGKNLAKMSRGFRKSVVAHRKGFSCEEEDSNCITDSVKMAQTLTPGITLPYLNAYLFMWCRCTRQKKGPKAVRLELKTVNSYIIQNLYLIKSYTLMRSGLGSITFRKCFDFGAQRMLEREHPYCKGPSINDVTL